METQVKVTAQVDEVAYTGLFEALKQGKKVGKQLQTAKAAQDGIYNSCMKAAAVMQSFEVADATLEALSVAIWKNEDGTAVAVGAEKRDEATKDGKVYKLPNAFSTVKSVILFAFENGLKLVDDNGNPKAYNALRKESQAVRAEVKKQEAEEAIKALTGIDLLRHTVGQAVLALAKEVSGMDEGALNSCMLAINPFIKTKEQKLHEANEAAKARIAQEQKPKRARASRKANADVGADLSKAA